LKANEFVGRFGLNSFKAAMVCPQFNRYEYAILYSDEVDFSNDLIEKHKNYMFKTSEIKCLVESHAYVEIHGLEQSKEIVKNAPSDDVYYSWTLGGSGVKDKTVHIGTLRKAIAEVESCTEAGKRLEVE